MGAVAAWLWANTAGNLVASAICVVVGWFWKVRPHLHAQRAHHANVADWIEGLHTRLDAAGIPNVDGPQQTGAHGETETLPAVQP